MKNYRILFVFIIFFIFLTLLFGAFLFLSIVRPPSYFSPVTKKIKLAMRGNIFTKYYNVAKSEKIYAVSINPVFINPLKKNLFINLFSIYADVNKFKLKRLLYSKKYIILAKVDLKTAQNLKYLLKVLDKKRVFVADKNGIRRGYYIEDFGFKRVYPYNDTLEPVLGRYTKNKKDENGLEKYYDSYLAPIRNGFIKGNRDVYGNIIYDKDADIVHPVNGKNLKLNINLVLQRKIEKLLSIQKQKFKADEVMAAVMDSRTGKILAIASSNRYNPNFIQKKDIKNMKIGFIRTLYEPGSVMKPIIFAILLNNNKVNPYEILNAYNGKWKPKWRRTYIIDDDPFKWLSAENALVYSSNIVISQLSLRLKNTEYYKGLINFGLGRLSGIDLPYELKGYIPSIIDLHYPIYKSTTAYGYGILVTFIQLLKAYNSFNNQGIEIIPKIADVPTMSHKVMSAKNATLLMNILRKIVLKGTAQKAFIQGIFTAGKTGTAQRSVKGVYGKTYNSSFFGFADDNNHKYTIAVTFINIKAKWPNYFASSSAVPTFKKIVDIMLELNLLKRMKDNGLSPQTY